MAAVSVELGELAFEFESFSDWVNSAQRRFKQYDLSSTTAGYQVAICVDAKSRVCSIGGDFMRARDEKAFPVRVYKLST